MIAYEGSDGWYDHQMGPVIRQSTNDTSSCGTAPAAGSTVACGVGPRQPLLVISPWSKRNFVDNTFTDQSSIVKFIEDNWLNGQRISGSADAASGTLMNAFNFNQRVGHTPAVILNDKTGEVERIIRAGGGS